MAKVTFEEVRDVVVETLRVEKDRVTPQSRFVDDLKADSLDLVELVMAVEEHFKIEIPDDDNSKLVTVQDAVDYLNERLS